MIRRLRDLTSYVALAYRAAVIRLNAAHYRRERDAALAQRDQALAERDQAWHVAGLLDARRAELQQRHETCEREHGRLRLVTDPPGGDAA